MTIAYFIQAKISAFARSSMHNWFFDNFWNGMTPPPPLSFVNACSDGTRWENFNLGWNKFFEI
jgi:hypothetical protein